jgi:hypothetical protein
MTEKQEMLEQQEQGTDVEFEIEELPAFEFAALQGCGDY